MEQELSELHQLLRIGNVSLNSPPKLAGSVDSEDITPEQYGELKRILSESTNLIAEHTLEKVCSLQASTILTYGWSPVIEHILLKLSETDITNLHIKVVDGAVDGPGKKLVKKLIERGVQCTYGLLNCLATELPHTHLVLLGATAVWSNGSLLVARGAASVTQLAQCFNVPVLTVVKSHQFIDKVYTIESLTSISDADRYETISSEMISGLVTDIRILPPSSAPAILKTKSLPKK